MFDWVWHLLDSGETRSPTGGWRRLGMLLLSLGIFVGIAREWADPGLLAILIGSLVFHELGHFVAMLACGYRDVQMFFIPFVGAAVTGRKHAAPAWQRAVVALAGPVPGIALAGLAYFQLEEPFADGAGLVVAIVLAMNLVNLIPIEPFDGGRFASVVIYPHCPVGEVVVFATLLGGLGFAAWQFPGIFTVLLFLLAVVVLAGPVVRRLARSFRIERIRHRFPKMSAKLGDLAPGERLLLFRDAVDSLGGSESEEGGSWPHPQVTARAIRDLHEATVTRPPGPEVTALLLTVYFCAFGSVAILWQQWASR